MADLALVLRRVAMLFEEPELAVRADQHYLAAERLVARDKLRLSTPATSEILAPGHPDS